MKKAISVLIISLVVFVLVFAVFLLLTGAFSWLSDDFPITPTSATGRVICPEQTYYGEVNALANEGLYIIETEEGRVWAPKHLCTFVEDG